MAFVSKLVLFSQNPIQSAFPSSKLKSQRAFTFVEVMVTLVILSIGFTVIFRTLFYSLDKVNSLSNRIQADVLIENRLSEIERFLRVYNALPMQISHNNQMDVGNKKIDFKEKMSFQDVEELPDVFRLNFSVSWSEGKRLIELNRSAYLLDINRNKFKQ